MKYQKTFYVVCVTTFLITLALIALIACVAFNVVELPTSVLIAACVSLLAMVFLSFCCGCILQSLLNDWRRIKRNGKWKH